MEHKSAVEGVTATCLPFLVWAAFLGLILGLPPFSGVQRLRWGLAL